MKPLQHRAVQAYQNHDYPRARRLFRRLVGQNPENEMAWLLLAEMAESPDERRTSLEHAARFAAEITPLSGTQDPGSVRPLPPAQTFASEPARLSSLWEGRPPQHREAANEVEGSGPPRPAGARPGLREIGGPGVEPPTTSRLRRWLPALVLAVIWLAVVTVLILASLRATHLRVERQGQPVASSQASQLATATSLFETWTPAPNLTRVSAPTSTSPPAQTTAPASRPRETPTGGPPPARTRSPAASPTRAASPSPRAERLPSPQVTESRGMGLPDLAVVKAAVALERANGCYVPPPHLGTRVEFRNAGGVDAGPFSVMVNGARKTVSGLRAGASGSLWFASYSTRETEVVVDVASQVAEDDEGNNVLRARLPIPTPPGTCTPP